MADPARAAAKPAAAVQRDPAASKKPGAAAAVAAPAVNGPLGALYSAGPVWQLAGVQAKVVVGPPDDPFEREADSVAERVTAGGTVTRISRLPANGLSASAQRLPARGLLTDWTDGTDRRSVQRQAEVDEEEEPAQTLAVQRQAEVDEEEEPAQTLAVQRQSEEEKEEPAQALAVQRQAEEEPVQHKAEDEPLKRSAFGIPRVTGRTAATIHNPGAGQPIAPAVRNRIEPQLAADLGGVRVHTGPEAHRAAASMQARAFTHRQHVFLGRGESPANLRLMAHEATHVVQQGAAVQRLPLVSRAPEQVQRLPAFITDRLAEYARYIPGYTLFTVIIGYNPLTGADVDRTPMNLVEGIMSLVPFGAAIFDKLRELGILQRAFEWIEEQLDHFDLSIERLERLIEEAYEEMDFIRLDPFDYNLGVLTRKFEGLLHDVRAFAGSLVDAIIELIKEAAIGLAEGQLAENRAWALLKKVLHYDPLRGEEVNATTEEILADFLLLIGKETELAQMQERGTLAETAAWLDTQFATFTGLIAQLGALFSAAWDAIQPENLPDLASNLQSLADQVVGFVQQVWDFASTVALKVLELIKKSLLGWLASFADEAPGFHLITVILGRNPFTEEAVPRTAENIIRGFITLLPGGNATYQQLAETGTIAQAAAAIEGAMAELGISWELITGIFLGIWDGLSIDDLLDPVGAFTRIVDQFGEPISRVFAFIRVVLRELFALILELMGFPSDLIGSIISNALQAFESIKRDPIGFFKNMLASVKQGFSQFFDNILQHLLGGLVDWLFRGLREAGIEPPADLSLGSILDFVLQVLGISMERIWQKLAEHVGQETVDRIRGAVDRLVGIWSFVRDVQERGVGAIWEYIEGQISGLWDMVLEQARNWIMERIVNRAIQWLLSLLDPTGIMPVINSFMAFFRAVQSAIDYLRDILAIINDYVSTVAAIARGELQPGADRLEQGLANAIPVAIGFLANQFGLGRIGDKIAEIVGGIRGLVDRALDWLIGKAVAAVQSVLHALGIGAGSEEKALEDDPEKADRVRAGLAAIDSEEQRIVEGGKISYQEAVQVAASVKQAHPVFTRLEVVDGVDSWDYRWEASPGDTKETTAKKEEGGEVGAIPDATVAVPFGMNGEGHTLTGASSGGSLQITMASRDLLIFNGLTGAIAELEAMPNFRGRSKIIDRLRRALVLSDVNNIAVEWSNLTKEQGKQLPQGVNSWESYLQHRLSEVISEIDDLAVGSVPITALTEMFRQLNRNNGPYSYLVDPPNVGPYEEFSATQRTVLLAENMAKNGGQIIADDGSGLVLDDSLPATDPCKPNIDHIFPRVLGGSNSYSNARVIARDANSAKRAQVTIAPGFGLPPAANPQGAAGAPRVIRRPKPKP